MNDWINQFVSQCLADVPPGQYRTRAEKELRDHMESQQQALVESGTEPRWAEEAVKNTMGDPEKLRAEYEAAWEQSLQARLGRMRKCVSTWGKGFAVMLGVHYLIALSIESSQEIASWLSGNFQGLWVRLIQDASRTLNGVPFWRHLFPLALALTAGAFYLNRRFHTSRRPAGLISAGLFFYWAYIAAGRAWFRALDNHHRPFWEAVGRHFYYNAGHYCFTFLLCILLGVLFGQKREKRRELA